MKRQLVLILGAILMIAAACSNDGPDGDAATQADSTASPTAAAPGQTDETEMSDESAVDAGTLGGELVAPEAFAANPAGTYGFDFGGGQLVVSAPAEFFFADLGNAVFLDDPANPGGASNYYGFIQPTSLPTDVGSAESSDPDTWIAETSSLTVEARDVSDPRWQIYRLTTDTTIDLATQVQLKPGELYELWFLVVDAPDPLVLMGKTVPSTPEALEVLPQVAESVQFEPGQGQGDAVGTDDGCAERPWECGEPSVAPAGVRVCVPAMGGLGFEMSEERMVLQPNPWFVLIEAIGPWEGSQSPALVVIKPSQTVDGEPITTAQQVFELQDAVMEMTPIESRTFFGSEVAGYAFVGDDLEPALFSVVTKTEQDELGVPLEAGFISPPPIGEVWFVDTPDGPLIVSAAAWLEDELPIAQLIVDEVGPSLELQPSGCP